MPLRACSECEGVLDVKRRAYTTPPHARDRSDARSARRGGASSARLARCGGAATCGRRAPLARGRVGADARRAKSLAARNNFVPLSASSHDDDGGDRLALPFQPRAGAAGPARHLRHRGRAEPQVDAAHAHGAPVDVEPRHCGLDAVVCQFARPLHVGAADRPAEPAVRAADRRLRAAAAAARAAEGAAVDAAAGDAHVGGRARS